MKKVTPHSKISPQRRSQRILRSSLSPNISEPLKETHKFQHSAKLEIESFPLKALNKENKDSNAGTSGSNIYQNVIKGSKFTNKTSTDKENLNNLEIDNRNKNEICNVSGLSSNGSPDAQNNKVRSVLYTSHNGSKDTSYSFLSTQAKLQLSSWGLPESVLKKYEEKGITTMFQWQAECLALPGVLSGKNLVYSAPTSAGKTLVAELLLLKRVLETGKKGIFILPFVSVAREKMYYLQKIFGCCGVRVEGFMGSQGPPGGLKVTDIAVCTIEKANNLINRLLEAGKLDKLGMIVVDELHMLGDSHRGYLLELMLTKVLFMTANAQKEKAESQSSGIQIIGMSATLPNLNVLAEWLNGQLYHTDYRPVPLTMNIKLGNTIYDANMKKIRELNSEHTVKGDSDQLIQLCLETVLEGFSVLVFCPSKAWCEKLAESVARAFFSIGKPDSQYPPNISAKLREILNPGAISRVLDALQKCPVGLDKVLQKSVSFGAAYHHAGLTFEERDIIEGGFRTNSIKVLIATSTLSSGVNLPARRVIIRSPMFGGSILDTLTYRQMAGRAGRKGVDTQGESILVCRDSEAQNGKRLIKSTLPPITSCLQHDASLTSSMKRAMLEVIVSGVACSPSEIERYFNCTLLATSLKSQESNSQEEKQDAITVCVDFLLENEFIRLQEVDELMVYVGTHLGMGVLASGLSPDEGLHVFSELHRARQCFVLENELHLIYQVTPIYMSWPNLEWLNFLSVWEGLTPDMRRVGELVGVEESFIVRAMKGTINFKVRRLARKMAIHQRFYIALALHELVQEIPLNSVAEKYSANKGMLQSLQMSAATFAGMVTVFCKRLGWHNLETLIAQFHDRLHFGIQRELCDLVRLTHLNGQRARELYNEGLETVMDVAQSTPQNVESIFRSAMPFHSAKTEGEHVGTVWLTGDKPTTPAQAANLIINEARTLIKKELGLASIDWSQRAKSVTANNREEISPNRSAHRSSHLLLQDTLNHSTTKSSFISRRSFGSDKKPLLKKRRSKSPFNLTRKSRSPRELSKRRSFSPKNLIDMSKRRCLRNKIVENEVQISSVSNINDNSLITKEVTKQTKPTSPKGVESKTFVSSRISHGDNETHIRQKTLLKKDNKIKLKIDSLENNTELEKVNKGSTSKTTAPLEDLDIGTKAEKHNVVQKISEEFASGASSNLKKNQSTNILVDASKLAHRKLPRNINKFEKFNESIGTQELSIGTPENLLESKKYIKQKESKDLNRKPKNLSFKNKSEFVPTESEPFSTNEKKKEILLEKNLINNEIKEFTTKNSATNVENKPKKSDLCKLLFGKKKTKNNELDEKPRQRINETHKSIREDKNDEIQELMTDGNHCNQENDAANGANKPKKSVLSKVLFGKPKQKNNELDKKTRTNIIEIDDPKRTDNNDFCIPESQESKADNVFSPKHKHSKRPNNKMKIVNSASLVKKLNDTKRELENQTSTPIRDFVAQNNNGQNILKNLCENGISEIKPKILIKDVKNKSTENSDEPHTSNKHNHNQGTIALSNNEINSVSPKIDFEDTMDDIVANLSFNESQGFEMAIKVSDNKLIRNLDNNHGRESDLFDNSTEKSVHELQEQIYVENEISEKKRSISNCISKKGDSCLFDELNYKNDTDKYKQHTNKTTSRRYTHEWNTLDSQDFIDISMENNLKEYDVMEKTNEKEVIHRHVHSVSQIDSDVSSENLDVSKNGKRYAELVNNEAIDEFSKVDKNESGVLWDTMNTVDFAGLSAGSENNSDTSISDPDLNGDKRARQLREKIIQEFSDVSSECYNLEDIEKELDNDTDISAGSDIIEFVGKVSLESKKVKTKDRNNTKKRSISSKVRPVGLSRPRSSGKSSKRKMPILVNESFKRPKLECSSIDKNRNKRDSIIPDMKGMETPLYEACSEELDFGVELTKSEGNLNSDLNKINGVESLNNGSYICTRKDSGMFERAKKHENEILVLSEFDTAYDLNQLEGNDVPLNGSRHTREPVSQQQNKIEKKEENDNLNGRNGAENANETISDSFLEEAFESYFAIPSQTKINSVLKINAQVNHLHDVKVDKEQHFSISHNIKVPKKLSNVLTAENVITDIGEPITDFGDTFACISQWNVTEGLTEEKYHKAQLIQDINKSVKSSTSIANNTAVEKNMITLKPEGSKLNKKQVSKERLSHDLFASTPPEPKEIIKVKEKDEGPKRNGVKSKVNLTETFIVTDINNDSNMADRNIESNENSFNMSDSFQCSSDSLYIIDVVGDGQLFKTFIEEWSQQTVFSMSLACEKKQTQAKQGEGIGWRIGNGVRSSRRAHKTKEEVVAGVFIENTELLIVGIAICWGHEVYYINLRTTQECPISCSLPTPPISENVPFEERVEKVKHTLEKLCIIGNCAIRMWDVKTSVRLLAASNIGYFSCQLEDPKVAAWMLDPSDKEKSIQDLVLTYDPAHQHLLSGVGVSWGHGPLGINPKNPGSPRIRAATESLIIYNLMVSLKKHLNEVGMLHTFQEVEMGNVTVLAYMELTGMGFSLKECEAQQEIMQNQLSKLEKEAYSLVGHTFSLTSPDEVSQVLYKRLRLPNQVAKKSGRGGGTSGARISGSTNKEALEKLTKLHPLPGVILEWRRINSSLTKVVFPLQQARIHCSRLSMDRIHSSASTFTATGRVTMHDPNLQMMPRDFNIQVCVDQQHNLNSSKLRQQRALVDSGIMEQLAPLLTGGETEEHTVSLRHALVPRNGHVMLAADYSQLELRILAHLSSDKRLLGLLNSGEDVFKSIAAQIHTVNIDQVTDDQRQAAKQVCYGMLYGMGARALAEQLSIEEEDAYDFMDKFMKRFPGVQKFLNSTVEICRKQGYVTTIFGRRRYLPNISSQNAHSKAQSERQAVNTSIQGSAADLVKLAMVKINNQLHEAFPNSPYFITQPMQQRKQQLSGAFLVLQLHDELIYEVVAEDLVQVAQLVQFNMENVKKLAVELPIKIKVGPSWGTMQTLTL